MNKSTLRALELLRKRNQIDITSAQQAVSERQACIDEQQRVLLSLAEMKATQADPTDMLMTINADRIYCLADILSVHQQQEISVNQAHLQSEENTLFELNRNDKSIESIQQKLMDELRNDENRAEQRKMDDLIASRFHRKPD